MTMHIYVMRISSYLSVDIANFSNYVSNNKIRRITKFKYRSDFIASFMADILAKYTVSVFTGKNAFNEKIILGEHGKPFMNIDDVNFSLSHSGDYIVCCVSKENIGVDIQKNIVMDEVLMHYLDKKETEFIQKSKNSKSMNDFLVKHWVLREAYLKYTGDGLFGNINELHFDLFTKFPILYSIENDNSFYVQSLFNNDYTIGICSDEIINNIIIRHVLLEDLEVVLQSFSESNFTI